MTSPTLSHPFINTRSTSPSLSATLTAAEFLDMRRYPLKLPSKALRNIVHFNALKATAQLLGTTCRRGPSAIPATDLSVRLKEPGPTCQETPLNYRKADFTIVRQTCTLPCARSFGCAASKTKTKPESHCCGFIYYSIKGLKST